MYLKIHVRTSLICLKWLGIKIKIYQPYSSTFVLQSLTSDITYFSSFKAHFLKSRYLPLWSDDYQYSIHSKNLLLFTLFHTFFFWPTVSSFHVHLLALSHIQKSNRSRTGKGKALTVTLTVILVAPQILLEIECSFTASHKQQPPVLLMLNSEIYIAISGIPRAKCAVNRLVLVDKHEMVKQHVLQKFTTITSIWPIFLMHN